MKQSADRIAIFDIDGTVIDTQLVEGECYAQAMLEVTGLSLETLDWTTFQQATSSGIFREVCGHLSDAVALEIEFESRFLELLQDAHPHHPADFQPIPGAIEFLDRLMAEPGIEVAFATGGYHSEANFKLSCCGIDIAGFPHATSSDSPNREEIIRLAATRAGCSLSSAVYFADGIWDVIATRELGMPMIGIGRKVELLQSHNVKPSFRDFCNSDLVLEAFKDAAG